MANSSASDQIDLMARFIKSLTEYYGATKIANPSGHRQFTNPWAYVGGDGGNIFIVKKTGRVRFGSSVTRSTQMSERMMQSIANREQRKVEPKPVDSTYPIGARTGRTKMSAL